MLPETSLCQAFGSHSTNTSQFRVVDAGLVCSAMRGLDQLRVDVNAGHDADANCSPHGLGHLAVIPRLEAGVLGVLDAAQLGDVLGHDSEVLVAHQRVSAPRCHCHTWGHIQPYLVFLQRVQSQRLEGVDVGSALRPLPLLGLDAGEVVRRVDIANLPATRRLELEIGAEAESVDVVGGACSVFFEDVSCV